MQLIPKSILVIFSVMVLFWNCAPQPGTGASPQELDKLNKAQARDEKFQKVAFQKITELEKSLGELKKSQQQLNKMVRDLQQMKSSGTLSGGSSARLDSLVQAVADLNLRLQQLQQSAATPQTNTQSGWQNYTTPQPTRSDQDAVLQRFGDPIERHLTDANTEVWLYRNGVVTFDQNGQLTSIKFD
ncbi:MAG: hypothetical protein K9N34_01985 [Candidatus Marinimicrobia bacterium]|nr:hypothetical protein [Candidatus Neomarinimicrobiota bacterium]MCF7839384.1 hypothetical protein [Candidatus Neomarinimicrobiota bacterium]MCF7903457.1 hypothetical protein [Candidatus Neomarinimicrobiota bacterium]